ncbi:hypothetical protein BCR43DRAFT_498841 [Syncephalastrum racemosum]|uniref:HIT-type domain-containing protein n=1 Tax=Syncephalastrum racemosum TaxID=13706 RepID=A0A1X2H1P6_SYNRA|nr:hypothetical protein BCR43DRAFT_498841 [Syncephalastrum racemosum]
MAGLCKICSKEQSKYKCSTCRIEYCSVACYKQHKEFPCEPYVEPPKQPEPRKPLPTDKIKEKELWEVDEKEDESLLKEDELLRIGHSDAIREYLQRSDIREIVKQIDASKDPEKDLAEARANGPPEFEAFLRTLLKTTGRDSMLVSEDQDPSWRAGLDPR